MTKLDSMFCVSVCVCENTKAKGKLSEERKTEQEIQQEEKLEKSFKLNPEEDDGKANKRAPVRLVFWMGQNPQILDQELEGRGSRKCQYGLGQPMEKPTVGRSSYSVIFHFILIFSFFR